MMDYLTNIGGAVSQLANVIFLLGNPNESISGRSHREPWPLAKKIINKIFFLQKDHCKEAYEADLAWVKNLIKQESAIKGQPELL